MKKFESDLFKPVLKPHEVRPSMSELLTKIPLDTDEKDKTEYHQGI